MARRVASLEYAAGRLAAVFFRPGLLFAANNWLAVATAAELAVVFVSTALSLLFANAPVYRSYYQEHFAQPRASSEATFRRYVAGSSVVTLLGSLSSAMLTYAALQSVALAAVAAVFFVAEKVCDELLRYKLLDRQVGGWGRFVLARTTLHAAAVLALVAFVGRTVDASALLAGMTVMTIGVAIQDIGWRRLALALSAFRPVQNLAVGISVLYESKFFWVVTLLGAGIGYMDRAVALTVEEATLPLFTLVVMCFSAVGMLVQFVYLSPHRRDFLDRSVTPWKAMTHPHFLGSLLAGAIISSVAVVFVLATARNGDRFPWTAALAIAVLQMAVAASKPLFEIVYWKSTAATMLRIESMLWLLTAIIVGVALAAGARGLALLPFLAVAAVIRVIGYFRSAQANPGGREPGRPRQANSLGPQGLMPEALP